MLRRPTKSNLTDTLFPNPTRFRSNAAVYNASGKLRDIALDEISDVLANDDDSFVWVGVYEPEDAVLDKLQEEFDLHDLAIEDARNAHQRPKLEAYGDS